MLEEWEVVADFIRLMWSLEDLHQGLKTGCQLEQRYLQDYEGMRTLLGVLVPLAVRLLQLRAAARQEPELPASQALPADVVAVVAYLDQRQEQTMTSQQCWYAIARRAGRPCGAVGCISKRSWRVFILPLTFLD